LAERNTEAIAEIGKKVDDLAVRQAQTETVLKIAAAFLTLLIGAGVPIIGIFF
jgi:hypothetical protein